MKNKYLFALLIIIVVLFIGYYVMKKGGTRASSSIDQNNSVQQLPASGTQSVQETSIDGNEFTFSPSAITVKRGQTVRLTFNNTGAFPHNLVIGDLNVRTKTIEPGQKDTIMFIADKTGQFAYTCTVDSHAQKGMTGVLTVE